MSARIITALSCGALALGGAFVAGCGTDNSKSSSTQGTNKAGAPSAPQTSTAAGAAKASVIQVSMKNNTFIPEKITGKVGQTVRWTNDDSYPHNVVATKGENFQSSTFSGGGTYQYKLDKPGTISYVCTIHSGMVGTITVTK
jgi:plastocyanin